MSDILRKILATKVEEVAAASAVKPLAALRADAEARAEGIAVAAGVALAVEVDEPAARRRRPRAGLGFRDGC